MLKFKRSLTVLLAVTCISSPYISNAQTLSNPSARSGRENSPYSMFGIGTLSGHPNAVIRGFGGGGAAYTDPFTFNVDNPASYSFLKYSTFDVSADLRSRNVTFEGKPSRSSFTGSINNLHIGIPLRNFGGVSFGVHQLSNIFYNLADTINLLIDPVVRQYAGVGGFQKAYAGLSFERYNFSIGANFGYNFGQKESAYNIYNYSNLGVRNVDEELSTMYRGINWTLGALYKIKLKNDYFLNIGASYQLESELKGNKEGFVVSKSQMYNSSGQLETISLDTISKYNNESGKLVLPSILNLGLHFGNYEKLNIVADLKYYNWSNYANYGSKDSVSNSSFTSNIGFSYTPNFASLYQSKGSYLAAVTYRAGFFYNQDYVHLRNTKIADLGGSFGFSFPIKRAASNNQFGRINTTFTIGNRGTYTNGLAREFYFNLTLGASLNDLWFIKPVYD